MSSNLSSDEGKRKPGTGRPVDSSQPSGRFAYDGLDRVMHEKARLGILASLAASSDGVLFNDLKQLCALTDGNLSRHLGVLAEAGLVEVWKGGAGPRPQTIYRLTTTGRRRFSDYISLLEKVVADAQASGKSNSSPASFSADWSSA